MKENQFPGRTGFFSAFIGCCCGTAVFGRLRYNRWWRVLLHLCMISFLCAIGIAWGLSWQLRPRFQELEKRFGEEFGGLVWSAKGIVPFTEPEKARSFALPMGGVVDYRPANTPGSGITEKEAQTLSFLVFWRPHLLMTAVRNEATWLVWTQKPGAEAGAFETVAATELPAFLARQPQAGEREWEMLAPGHDTLSAAEVIDLLRNRVTGSLMFMMFGMCLGLTLLYTAIFVGMFRLTGGVRRLRNLTGGEFWKIGIYAAFPVMPVASCFPAFDLPFLSYGTVFMIGLVFYWLAAVGRVEREKLEGASQNEER